MTGDDQRRGGGRSFRDGVVQADSQAILESGVEIFQKWVFISDHGARGTVGVGSVT